MKRSHFLIYVTADEQDHSVDLRNFNLMSRLHPGVQKVRLFIVVSKINGSREKEEKFIAMSHDILQRSRWIELEGILTKGNIGRDLSSAKIGLDEISNYACPDDSVLIRNRSSIGPFKKNWYLDYLDLLDSKENVGLVGNTINLKHHPDVNPDKIAPHVQTYLYLSSFYVLDKMRGNFPGIYEVDRLRIISDGEIAISEKIMEMGYQIVSLLWPVKYFGTNIEIDESLPKKDMKVVAKGLPFMHRYGLTGFLKYRFYIFGWLGLTIYSFRKKSRNQVQTKKLDLFYS